jgi:hypothetical protein
MEEDLISKKELLDVTGISYGSLYRWKRKKLIPEEWFVRKSTFTGQETFFPRKKILARIETIKNMKEDLSLDDLADVFSPSLTVVSLPPGDLVKRNIVTKPSLDLFLQQYGETGNLGFEQILCVYVLDTALKSGDISTEEGKIMLEALAGHYRKYEGKSCELVFIRKMGVSTCFLISSPCELNFEPGARVVSRISVTGCIEELKINIGEGGKL